ncbi:MAG: hypothetical protein ACM3SO_12310 [Betaproteobacteria bacterium]
MRDWNPKSLWEELLRTFQGWMDEGEEDEGEDEQARDPALLFHLLFTVPLALALFAALTTMARHA